MHWVFQPEDFSKVEAKCAAGNAVAKPVGEAQLSRGVRASPPQVA